jgi:hypothetical protein
MLLRALTPPCTITVHGPLALISLPPLGEGVVTLAQVGMRALAGVRAEGVKILK